MSLLSYSAAASCAFCDISAMTFCSSSTCASCYDFYCASSVSLETSSWLEVSVFFACCMFTSVSYYSLRYNSAHFRSFALRSDWRSAVSCFAFWYFSVTASNCSAVFLFYCSSSCIVFCSVGIASVSFPIVDSICSLTIMLYCRLFRKSMSA